MRKKERMEYKIHCLS